MTHLPFRDAVARGLRDVDSILPSEHRAEALPARLPVVPS